jgi:hypothetical protein
MMIASFRFALVLVFGLHLFSSQVIPYATAAPIIYTIPRPAATDVSARTSIAIRADQPFLEASVQHERFMVVGDQSSVHPGRAVLSYDHRTVLFYPDQPFAPAERVTVSVDSDLRTISGSAVAGMRYTFYVSPKALSAYSTAPSLPSLESEGTSAARKPLPQQPSTLAAQTTYKTVPVNLPYWDMITNKAGAATGDIFLAPFAFPPFANTNPALIILDHTGDLVYYQHLQPSTTALDFKVQPNGMLSYFASEISGFVIMDNTYAVKRVIKAGNGYVADQHELQIVPNGDALLLIYDYVPRDLTSLGGLSNATVINLVVQEIDPANNVVFEWNSKDYCIRSGSPGR